ncbi:hypothetical protein PV10_05025 [Exophiala mesophila]|uniref:Uncharacterized protein n=1 Tax=Exophiala mesophila TaxID=212818 RepID=A0A0D1WWR9_EXOME|nr:uncharacterized protein PV10_05025 [Exophiala mesophila]KIV93840.1 hypothetical protein PV10_05025 [Exophiala mesophila]
MATASPTRRARLSELHRQVTQLYATSLLNRVQLLLIIREAGLDSPIGEQALKATENETEIANLLDKFRGLPAQKSLDPEIVGKEHFLRGYFCELRGDKNNARIWYRHAVMIDSQLAKSERIRKFLGLSDLGESSAASDGDKQDSTTVSPVSRSSIASLDRSVSNKDDSTRRDSTSEEASEIDSPIRHNRPKSSTDTIEPDPIITSVINSKPTIDSEGNIRHSELFGDLLAHTLVEGVSPYRTENFLNELTMSPGSLTSSSYDNSQYSQRGTGIDVGFRINHGPEGNKTFDDLYGRPRACLPGKCDGGSGSVDGGLRPVSNGCTINGHGHGHGDHDHDQHGQFDEASTTTTITTPTSPSTHPHIHVRHEHPVSTTRRPSLTVRTTPPPPTTTTTTTTATTGTSRRRLSEEGILTDIPALDELPKVLVSPVQISPSHAVGARRRSWGGNVGVDITPTSPNSPSRLRQSITIDDDE